MKGKRGNHMSTRFMKAKGCIVVTIVTRNLNNQAHLSNTFMLSIKLSFKIHTNKCQLCSFTTQQTRLMKDLYIRYT